MFRRKSIFDILNEAEEDDNSSSSSSEANTDDTGDTESSSEDNNDSSTGNDTSSDSDNSEDNGDDNGEDDEDFSIDTDLDDMGNDDGGDDSGSDNSSDDSSSTDTSSSDSSSDFDEEPVEANTDIFNSLTAEEQKIKIKELKNMFGELYLSCNDLLEKINLIDADDDMLDTVTRLSMTLYSLKQYIADYIKNSFAMKSYIENDVAFNRFLSILNSVSNITDEIANIRDEKLGKSDK